MFGPLLVSEGVAFDDAKSFVAYPLQHARPEQMRLAIEKRKKYTGVAMGKTRAVKKTTAKKNVRKKPVAKRPKSVKTRYGRHG